MSEGTAEATLQTFAAAWERHDVRALLQLFTEDAVYGASVGPEPGTTFRGHGEIAAGLSTMFAHDDGATILQGAPLVFGDAAVTTWSYSFADGRPTQRGVDLWRFRNGQVLLKDAYRKVSLAPTSPE